MTAQLRRVAGLLFALFAAVFVNLNYLQVLRAEDLSNDQRNSRVIIREYEIERGALLAGAGPQVAPVAFSEETPGPLRYLRRYPDGPLYAHVTGFYSVVYGRSGLEQAFNPYLVGSAPETFARNLGDLLSGRQRQGDDVATTVRPQVQQAARDALGARRGAVVALDPRDGALLALWSSPSYDPNPLASHARDTVVADWERTEADPAKPRLNRALRQLYPPGSTFKIVTAAAALEAGTGPAHTFPDPPALDLPLTTATISNFGGGTCNGGRPITLAKALAVSCNTTFAQLGLQLGAERLVRQAEAFGLNHEWEFQLPLEPSRIPADLDAPSTAQSAIGQRDVRVTPLQMAMIAGAVGNNGVLMTPRLVNQVTDPAGRTIVTYGPQPLLLPGQTNAQALSPQNAGILRELMVGVVEAGSGRNAAIPGVRVAGKTGTAQTGSGRAPTVWFVGFAPADDPRVAVAVVIEEGGDVGSEATGGRLAAPVARAVMQAALAEAPR
ncbi:MAG TPA: penicillin-binding protein 2 [Egibacteraceae bacterium]|nr:penicillin-binding protein 2 [Egibacteraceae bacterium]